MIGVIPKPGQLQAVEEFFQLFKTPWEYYRPGVAYTVVIATCDEVSNVNSKLLLICGSDRKSIDWQLGVKASSKIQSASLSYGNMLVPVYGEVLTFCQAAEGTVAAMAGAEMVGVKITRPDSTVIRLGYDLFEEVRLLLASSQPVEHAQTPTLDAHISMLRAWILEEGISLVEIPPVPFGYSFTACLTHDIDFIGIRRHKLDHTVAGFLYRSILGSVGRFIQGRITTGRLFETWRAAASLPLVYLGWAKDFWEPFEWYLKAEDNLPATYFLIPFKCWAGERVPGGHASRRATAYDVDDLKGWATVLSNKGCELGVHGLDAWHSVERARAERERVSNSTLQPSNGIRMHWLLQDSRTPEVLEEAGFAYDSTAGYNETVGYRNGTMQVFRPFGARTLLELPLHIQDGALFYSQRLDLPEEQAEERCQSLIENVTRFGGVLTLLWHDRSHGPERFWGDFYLRLIQKLKALNVWFGTAGQIVDWFRKRREVRFERLEIQGCVVAQVRYDGEPIWPPLRVQVHAPARVRNDGLASDCVDVSWDGSSREIDRQIAALLAVGNQMLF